MRVQELEQTIGQKSILKDLTFSLAKNEIVGLIGRNGSGKTTLFRTISNLYIKDHGDVFVDQHSLYDHSIYREQLFYLDEQFHFLNNQTPKKIEKIYKELYSSFDSEKYASLLNKYQLDPKQKVGQLSKGNRALFKMILAFSSQAKYYIFDEPFDGLDLIIKKKVINLLLHEVSYNQCSVIVSSHNLVELEHLIDHAIILKEGTIFKDFDLQGIKEVTKKFQMVFQKKEIPAVVRDNCQIIQVHGRVLIALFEKMTEELYEEILSLNPVLFEEVPLTLEDIFSSQFADESDYQLFI